MERGLHSVSWLSCNKRIVMFRLANENDARLKVLTKKIVKKTATDEKSKLNTKLAFCHGYVKPPPGVKVLLNLK